MKSNKGFVVTVVILAVLIHVFAVIHLFMSFENGMYTVMYRGEINKFDQKQEGLIKEFYSIPKEIKPVLIKHRQESGGFRVAAHSEVFFYLSKNDIAAYRDSLDKDRWTAINEYVGCVISFDNKDYVARYCYEGNEVWDEPLDEGVWVLESLNDDSDTVLVYIHQNGYIKDSSFAIMQYSPDYYKDYANNDYDV